jgi:hypothetical protein
LFKGSHLKVHVFKSLFFYGLIACVSFSILSCGNGDDNPCLGEQYVFFAKENDFLERLMTPEYRTVAFTDLRIAGRLTDTIVIPIAIDTIFVRHDGWVMNDCFSCDAEAETYSAILYIPNKDSIKLTYDECGYECNNIELDWEMSAKNGGFTIRFNDSTGIEHISLTSSYIIEGLQ